VNSIEAIVGDVDMTITVGFSASVSLGFWSYSASAGISIDFEGNVGVSVSVATAITTGDASASINGFMTVINAPTIKALEGESTQVGVSGAFGGSVSVDGVEFTSDGTDYFGLSAAVGMATPKLEGHVTIANTFEGVYSQGVGVKGQHSESPAVVLKTKLGSSYCAGMGGSYMVCAVAHI